MYAGILDSFYRLVNAAKSRTGGVHAVKNTNGDSFVKLKHTLCQLEQCQLDKRSCAHHHEGGMFSPACVGLSTETKVLLAVDVR